MMNSSDTIALSTVDEGGLAGGSGAKRVTAEGGREDKSVDATPGNCARNCFRPILPNNHDLE